MERMGRSVEVQRLARLLYYYTKVRGCKTIIHFFPHAVDDLLPTLALLEHQEGPDQTSTWELRYILLLWLSLICMIPFDLHKFDEIKVNATSSPSDTVANRIQNVGRFFLASSGKEKDAAAVMLGKLFQRIDASQDQFAAFLQWSRSTLLASPEPTIFVATGILQTLCNVVKAASPTALEPHLTAIQSIVSLYSANVDEVAQAANREGMSKPFYFSNNSLVNRYKAKMICRLGLKALKPKKRRTPLRATTLMGNGNEASLGDDQDDADEEIPEVVDGYIANLLDALQDKDTVVRYSAAKGLSRLCSRLPTSFVEQVSDAMIDMFSVNIPDFMGDKKDLSNVSEFTWQGCCLALAELARRGLLSGKDLSEKLEWVEKALMFDVRRGAHSVGTGVRDAACYVLWAIARAHEAESIRPMAARLSHRLVCVALLDRDISIRRAASAAYQECVGRLNLFENGIDIIRKTDFYSVGIRRNAFLVCAPQVAEHTSYRDSILDCLLNSVIVHWDPSMRELGAQSLAKILEADMQQIAPPIIRQLTVQCKSADAAILHGTLSSLAELAEVCHRSDSSEVRQYCTTIFASIETIPSNAIRPLAPSMVIRSACLLLAASPTEASLQASQPGLKWEDIIFAAMKRQEEDVQIAACGALEAISHYHDCRGRIEKVISDWKSLTIAQQQSNARAMGYYDFHLHSEAFSSTITILLSVVQSGSACYSANIETRRNAFESMAKAINNLATQVDDNLDVSTAKSVFKAMLVGLDDYTADARGDVGSWIRIACLTGMRKLFTFLIDTSSLAMTHWLDQNLFDSICAGYCKQMAERIDSVRTLAAIECTRIVSSCKSIQKQPRLLFKGVEVFDRLFTQDLESNLKDPSWLLSNVVYLLLVEEYRSEVLKGIVLCIGGQKELTNRAVATSLSSFLMGEECGNCGPLSFISDIKQLAAKNIKTNRYFVPAIQTLNVLFEEGVIDEAMTESADARNLLLKILEMVARNINVIKSVARVMVSMQ
jgi:hypothetical protein